MNDVNRVWIHVCEVITSGEGDVLRIWDCSTACEQRKLSKLPGRKRIRQYESTACRRYRKCEHCLLQAESSK